MVRHQARRPPHRTTTRTKRGLGLLVAVCCVFASAVATRTSFARGGPVLVEIDDGAESLLDARAARRLVALELADLDVPVAAGKPRGPAPLFFRVIRVDADLRVELWQRGDFLGARLVAGTQAAGQLGARRVALAAAELARRLQRKRQAQAERDRAVATERARALAREAGRALDGPLALRPSLEVADIAAFAATLVGPRLLGQWTYAKRTRLDLGLAWLGGSSLDETRAEWLELSLSPMRRVSLADSLDLDLGANLAAAWLRLGRVRGVDAIADQSETWSARVAAVLRVEPRLTRRLRLSVGVEAGLLLRDVPFQPLAGANDRLRGLWLGLDAGVVFTPR